MAKRRDKTLADYVVIAISPALIITLVGSLAFFLLEVSYTGQFEVRLRWILFWFVFGMVLVGRIAIEQGSEQAALYGLVLGVATAFVAGRFVDAVLVAWVLLAVIWWCTQKLTWDCTLIDETEDASGEGLLEAAGWQGLGDANAMGDAESGPARPGSLEAETESVPLWRRLFLNRPQRGARPHAPGLWVVYFSLAALPLFGVGQLFIPATDRDGRAYAFQLLVVYVASALGLLLTTSFLGLRRYLRQRKLQMPVSMTASWIGMGAGLLIAILLCALLLPRPESDYSLTALIDKIDAKAQEASRNAVVPGDRGKGKGRPIGDADKQGKEGGKQKNEQKQANAAGDKDDQAKRDPEDKDPANKDPADKDQKKHPPGGKGEGKADGQGEGKQQAQGKQQGGKQANDKPKGDNQPAKPAPAAQPPPQPAPPSGSKLAEIAASLAPFVKWILYGVLVLVAVYFALRHWSRIIAFLGRLLAELRELWNSLFGGKRDERGEAASDGDAAPVRRRFASFDDPFLSGAARRMSPRQLVLYTFEGLEAWAGEQVVERRPEQTPLEFAQALGRQLPTSAKEITQVAQLYAQVAYAGKAPTRDCLDTLEQMWRRMAVSAHQPALTAGDVNSEH